MKFDMNAKPDPLWAAIIAECRELERKYPMAMRGTGWWRLEGDDKKVACQTIYKGYGEPIDGYRPTYVFIVEAYYNHNKSLVTKLDGPYEDSHDEYWIGMRRGDNDRPYIVTHDWVHETISKDSPNPGQGDGFGGREFKLELLNKETAERFKKAGLKVEFTPNDEDPSGAILTTRNRWHQGVIPPKHRHLWTPNAKHLSPSPGPTWMG
jgi:hypothetical protein